LDRDPVLKTFLLSEVNHHIRDLAADTDSDVAEWEFFCECGEKECKAQVTMTLAEYAALNDGGEPVLAAGHRLSQTERAQRLREEAQALLAQAEQQVRRAEKIRRARQT
jgi:hypothetical protein